jgi:hypothetical protein
MASINGTAPRQSRLNWEAGVLIDSSMPAVQLTWQDIQLLVEARVSQNVNRLASLVTSWLQRIVPSSTPDMIVRIGKAGKY